MKKKAHKKKGDSASAPSCTASFGIDELLHVAQVFRKVSNNGKHSTDKNAKKIWDEVYVMFEELVVTANKRNE